MRILLHLFVILISLVASSASTIAGTTLSATVPAALESTANQELALTLTASGVQIYKCRAVPGEPKKFEWNFLAPEAELFDEQQHKVGRHYSGPTWELTDGGKVIGRIKAKADAPDGKGVPWLLLDAVQASGVIMGKVVSIQRVDTVGGKPPDEPADASKVGQERQVKYTATYKFYVPKQ
jgi:hypothetical protein